MAPIAYTDVGARYAFYVVLGMFGASEWSIRLRSRMNRGGTKHDRGSFFVIVATSLVGVGSAFVLAQDVRSAGIGVGRWPIFVVGLVLVLLGIALRQWSVLTLGTFFTVQVQVRSDQSVVDTGPYRWVRHPSYTAIVTSFVGIGVALENWLSLVVLVVVPSIGLVIRIRVEERALLEALGEPYREFSATRARLIPKVW
ncbi:MAG: isoprenylcysteine carboxylmethyltransferase family protein [Acidimicrobiales bacterium]|jgi:protein-S-isoprenylcysteine O-methyltransferase Ste14